MIRIAAFVALALLSLPAHASTVVCVTWEEARGAGLDKFGEVPAYLATLKIQGGEAVVTVTINPTTHSWSVVVQPTADKACIVMSGEGWQVAPEAVAHPPLVPVVPQKFWDEKGWNYITPASN